MHSTFVVEMTTWVSKIDQLKVLVVPFFLLVLRVSDEKVLLSQ